MAINLNTSKGIYSVSTTFNRYGKYGAEYISAMGCVIYRGKNAETILKKLESGQRKLPKWFYAKAEAKLHRQSIRKRVLLDSLKVVPKKMIPVYQLMGLYIEVKIDEQHDNYVIGTVRQLIYRY